MRGLGFVIVFFALIEAAVFALSVVFFLLKMLVEHVAKSTERRKQRHLAEVATENWMRTLQREKQEQRESQEQHADRDAREEKEREELQASQKAGRARVRLIFGEPGNGPPKT
jgi:hypothetical protein